MADRLVREGNEVRFYIHEPEARDIHKGLLTQVADYKESLAWAEYCVFTNNKLVDVWKECVKQKPCYGGSEAGQKLEKDRIGAARIAKKCGMKIPESLSVKTVAEVEKHLSEHEVKHVLKFTGGTSDSDSVLLGERDDNEDLIRFCQFIEGSGVKWDEIEIQELIDGVEAGVAAYFDGTKFAPGIEINFQSKRFAAGDQGNGVGFLTGEMGTNIIYVDETNKFFQRTLGKMVPYLQDIGYRGEIDCGMIVNEEGDYFIEWTPRTGIPDYVIRMELQVTPLGELFHGIATGNVKENKVLPGWAMGVVMVSPGFPDWKSSKKRSVGLPILGYRGNEEHCHLFEARQGKEGLEISEGGYGYPLVVTGKGKTLEASIRNTYWMLHRGNKKCVQVPKAWYRNDIGLRVQEQKEDIIELGILSEEEWSGEGIPTTWGAPEAESKKSSPKSAQKWAAKILSQPDDLDEAGRDGGDGVGGL